VSVRPAAAGLSGDEDDIGAFPHGTPLLSGGVLQAAGRDATFLTCPDVHSIKARHIVVASRKYGVAGGCLSLAAACDPVRIAVLASRATPRCPVLSVVLSSRSRR
jgi:hypothetical protein